MIKDEKEALRSARIVASGESGLTYDANWLEVIEASMRELEQLRAERKWRPIETAPRDGSPVLVFDGEHYAVGYWAPEIGEWWVSKKMRTTMLGTHWMPLPAPPETEEK